MCVTGLRAGLTLAADSDEIDIPRVACQYSHPPASVRTLASSCVAAGLGKVPLQFRKILCSPLTPAVHRIDPHTVSREDCGTKAALCSWRQLLLSVDFELWSDRNAQLSDED